MAMLTEDEAYLAMFAYLEYRWNITKSPDIGNCLSEMSLLPDGNSADPAIKSEWHEAVERVRSGQVDASLRLQR